MESSKQISSISSVPSVSIYERIVFRILRMLPLGRLEVEVQPSAGGWVGVHTFGEVRETVRATSSANDEERQKKQREVQVGRQKKDTPGTCARLIIKDKQFFKRVALYGDVGFGEAYVNGWWEASDLEAVLGFFLHNTHHLPGMSGNGKRSIVFNALNMLTMFRHRQKKNTIRQARENISDHYDTSNQFFEAILDKTMTYSAAYFVKPHYTLERAQLAKYDRLCQEAKLTKGDKVLEIGSGWGGFAQHAATEYGCEVTSITLSEEQLRYARERVKRADLAKRVRFELLDYRKVQGQFDKIISIEMIEAVGHHYLREFFQTCSRVLKPNGILALQAIVCPDFRYARMKRGSDWMQRHIFPGSFIPSIHALLDSKVRDKDFFLYNLKDLGQDYARTLGLWCTRLLSQKKQLQELGYDENFIRKWEYYFRYCQSGFARRYLSVVQLIFTRPDAPFGSDGEEHPLNVRQAMPLS